MDVGKNSAKEQPYRDYEPYPATPNGSPGSYPPVGLPPDPYDYNPYAQASPYPTTIPKSVRAARIISWVYAALGIALMAAAFAVGNYELGGVLLGGYLPTLLLGIFAFGYTVNGNGVRIAAIVCASFGIFVGLGSMVQLQPPGLLGIAVNLTIVILLSQSRAGLWFKRPH